MVVGEMAPKSWAIAHPERSAVLLALPFRGFAWVMRPVLSLLNAMANGCLRLVGVQPQNELAQVHGPKELALLLESAREQGQLEESEHRVLAGAIDLDTTRLTEVMVPLERAVAVAGSAPALDAERISRDSGRSRLDVTDGGVPVGIAHVRDIVRAPREAPVTTLTSAAMRAPQDLSLLDAISAMRAERAQLVLVEGPEGPVGLVTMEDLLERVLGKFDDETDPETADLRADPSTRRASATACPSRRGDAPSPRRGERSGKRLPVEKCAAARAMSPEDIHRVTIRHRRLWLVVCRRKMGPAQRWGPRVAPAAKHRRLFCPPAPISPGGDGT
jgi:CBS domain containing-hemolysin-like protein